MNEMVTAGTRWLTRHLGLLLLVLFSVVSQGCSHALTDQHPPLADKNVEIPVMIHIALVGDQPVISRTRAIEQLARANRELRPHGVLLYLQGVDHLPHGMAALHRNAERTRLANYAPVDGTLHVFYVHNVTVPQRKSGDRRVSGLHWSYQGTKRDLKRRMYLVVAEDAPNTTLAHEVGHAFGLEHQQDDPANIMCSCEREPDPVFSEVQGHQIRAAAHRFNFEVGNYDDR